MKIYIFIRYFTLLLCLFITALAVDKSNFKKCRDSSFCRFHRDKEPQSFKVLSDTLIIENDHLHGHIESGNGEDCFKFELFAFEDGIIRLKIDEASPTRKRYEIPDGDVIQPLLKSQNFQVKEFGDNHTTVISEDLRLVLNHQPFDLEVYVREKKVVEINSRRLFYIFKSKKPRKKVSWSTWLLQNLYLVEEDEDDETEDDWSEKFRSHTDTRPYGPSSVGMDVSFLNFSHVYGVPEHAHKNLALKSTINDEPYRLYNLDVFEYEVDNNMALYGSVPVMIAHGIDSTVGIFWNNPSETWIDVEHKIGKINTNWMSESGIIDLFVMSGPTPKDVFRQYAKITGSTPLPPLFSIAYHQSRWNYNDENDVDSVVKGFDEHNIPMDVIWLDIEHTYDKRYFTFDSNKFPTPKKMLKKVSRTKRRMVTAVDPHLKKDSSHYKIYSSASRNGLLVKDKDGKEYEGWCWPGSSAWLDFINPAVRKFWAERFLYSNYEGSTDHLFTWNDMNEPSVFNGPEITMHKDNLHHGDREHREVHNAFGLYVQRSSFEGQLLRSEGKARPFVLSRSFYSGSQKYGAVWTGDNAADWDHLEVSLPMVTTLNLVGMTFSGADVGGFFKNPSPELLVRWYQAAAFHPFFRAHAHLDTKRREPWLYSQQEMDLIRKAIKVRYSLLPYWYLLFFQSETSGEPIVRPLWTEFPKESETFDIADEFMLGNAVLLHPVTRAGAKEVRVYLPGCGEVWYDTNYKAYAGCSEVNYPVSLETIPTFYRGGQIVPIRERIRRSSMVVPNDPYSLVVYLDKEEKSHGYLYHDDFLSYEYKNGSFIYKKFTYVGTDWQYANLTSRSMNSKSESFTASAWIERIYIVGRIYDVRKITLTSEDDERPLETTYDDETPLETTYDDETPLETTYDDETPLETTYDYTKNLLVIRKPGINIDADFTIDIWDRSGCDGWA